MEPIKGVFKNNRVQRFTDKYNKIRLGVIFSIPFSFLNVKCKVMGTDNNKFVDSTKAIFQCRGIKKNLTVLEAWCTFWLWLKRQTVL